MLKIGWKDRMTKKQTRIVGTILVIVAVFALTLYLPGFFPRKVSRGGFTIARDQQITQIALGYLLTGMSAGFGLALLLWPFAQKRGANESAN